MYSSEGSWRRRVPSAVASGAALQLKCPRCGTAAAEVFRKREGAKELGESDSTLRSEAARHGVTLLRGIQGTAPGLRARALFPEASFADCGSLKTWNLAEKSPDGFLGLYTRPLIVSRCETAPTFLRHLGTEGSEMAKGIILAGNPDEASAEALRMLGSALFEAEILPPPLPSAAGLRMPEPGMVSRDLLALPSEAFCGALPETESPDSAAAYWSRWLSEYVDAALGRQMKSRSRGPFYSLMKAAAAHCGLGLNLQELASESGVPVLSVRKWMTKLCESCVTRFVPPVRQPEGHRHIKRPKLFFTDTGLACYLMNFAGPSGFRSSGAFRPVIMNALAIEMEKAVRESGGAPSLSYYEDTNRVRVDFILEVSQACFPVSFAENAKEIEERLRNTNVITRAGLRLGTPTIVLPKEAEEVAESFLERAAFILV